MAERVEKSAWRNRFNSISTPWNTTFSVAMILLALFTLAPLVLVVIVSFSSSLSIARNGYTFFPSEFSTDAYAYLIKTGSQVRDSYLITIFYTVAGTFLSLFVMSMYAFVLSQKRFHAQKFYTYVLFFTMLFSGGLVPSYIVNVRYLHMYDTIWIFLLPSLISAYNCIILRTFINTSIPDALFEAARIDGASNFRVYLQIVLPLFKAGLATIGLFQVVGRWNNWFTGLLYIESPKLIPLQTMLQRIQRDIDFVKKNSDLMGSQEGQDMLASLPTESMQMAILVVSILPILFAYPFFQRYFVQGITIGSVKG